MTFLTPPRRTASGFAESSLREEFITCLTGAITGRRYLKSEKILNVLWGCSSKDRGVNKKRRPTDGHPD